ncbi:MAG: nicotinate (nicotinamide) nucleotide adenylyltransferase [Bacilli bacterium]|jgi:nicotinate-nucleotide adenylyltransferase|nr:nicotinate (nicotinamide) nucleotide adenylyltransferase [Bacilli bacterium]MDD3388846.1 nicotinate (nicotinamide) nucleotide adenylyltransferase [Bacilli bacterium]MDD4345003.1 nicotinate (nicotinamide) nucleotide adenylyltransferase [Bacilli bacterium]MDD4520526.1 nicotinate (nicotinamide) nucleotide adenylyltransferase [Bacilli bacterium]MDY0399218.1 nicotinate (nicotinamide) nucleotide adenylyltransferase [Bacilli bacterium]
MAKIILFGGSFDPIHHGHFLMADQARLQIEAKQVIFIPAKNPRWKLPKLNGEHRFQMLKRYLNAYDWADVSRYELDGDEEVNYSIDTIKYFKKTHPNDELFWLLGADQVTKFHEWKNPELIASLVQLLVYARPKSSINQATISRYHMHVITGPESNASSSAIRECQSLDTSLSVLDYIQDNYLYYVDRLGRYLDELRRNHSFEVAKLAYQIAVSNQMNGAQAYLAGLLHDIGKNVLPPLREKIMEEHYPHYLSLSKVNYHQFIGEFLAQEDFKIVDEEVLKAIRTHNTGAANMRPLQMIIYAADKIEPSRGFDSRSLIEACLHDYHDGFLVTLSANRQFLINKKKKFDNPLTNACFKQYLKE